MRIVVVGGGMAGARLVRHLAPHDGLDVTLVGEEPHTPYNRVLLAEVLAGRYGPEVTALPAAPGARVRRGVRAVRIDRAERAVVCDDGSVVPYDRLVLATGSNPILPPLRGLFEMGVPPRRSSAGGRGELPRGVHAFRTMDDCLALSEAVRPGVRAVVAGGGLLGVSAARALAARGAQVVVATQGEYLMERHLDVAAARLLRTHLESLGVEVHTECRVRGLSVGPDAGRTVRSVELADGYRLDADLTVLACGVRPRVGLARAAGLAVTEGIVVDDELRTSDPYVHAVGDCAEHDGVVYGLAGPACDQADVLARVLAGAVAPAAVTSPAPPSPGYRRGHPNPVTGAPPRTRPLRPKGVGGPPFRPKGVGGPPVRPEGVEETPVRPEGVEETPVRPEGVEETPVRPEGVGGRPPVLGHRTGSDSHAAPRYTGTRALTRLTLNGPGALDIATFGETVPAAGDDVLRLSDATRGTYRKVVMRGDRLVGGILLGDLAAVGTLARTWEGDEPLPSGPGSAPLHLLTNDGGS